MAKDRAEAYRLAGLWTEALTIYYRKENRLLAKHGEIPPHEKADMDKLRTNMDELRRKMRIAQGISDEFA